jgi:glutathione S-transferase
MPEIELYGNSLCPFAQRVRLVLAEKELQATEFEIDLRNKPAEFLSKSPLGKVPLLVHGRTTLWESAVINEYLDECFPHHPLLPGTPELRAGARMWIGFADSRIYEPSHRLLLSVDPGVQARIAAQLADELRFIELHALSVHGGPYWLGGEFSLADVAFFPWFEQMAVLERFRKFRFPTDCSRLRRWFETVGRRRRVAAAARSSDHYLKGYAPLLDALAASASSPG